MSNNATKHQYRYLLGLGSNLGDRPKNLQWAINQVSSFGNILHSSEFIETKALLTPEQLAQKANIHDFFNVTLDLSCSLLPKELYDRIKILEDFLGHPRDIKWGPRHLDIDILLWACNNHQVFTNCTFLTYDNNQQNLYIPHRELKNRPFLLNGLMTLEQGIYHEFY